MVERANVEKVGIIGSFLIDARTPVIVVRVVFELILLIAVEAETDERSTFGFCRVQYALEGVIRPRFILDAKNRLGDSRPDNTGVCRYFNRRREVEGPVSEKDRPAAGCGKVTEGLVEKSTEISACRKNGNVLEGLHADRPTRTGGEWMQALTEGGS